MLHPDSSDIYINRGAYDPVASSSGTAIGQPFSFSAAVHGQVYTDTLTIGGLSLPDTGFGWPDADSDDVAFGGPAGSVGLGPPAGLFITGLSVLGVIAEGKLLPEDVYTFSPVATLTLGGVPDEAAQGAFYLDSAANQWTVAGSVGGESFTAKFDISYDYVRLLPADAQTVLTALGLSPYEDETGTIVAEADCNGIEIPFDFGGGHVVTLKGENSVVQDDSSKTGCTATLIGVEVEGDSPQWVLGAPFFKVSGCCSGGAATGGRWVANGVLVL